MSQTTAPGPDPVSPTNWRTLHAYGWPAGSVRALMAILIFATLWCHLVLRPDREVPQSFNDLLFIILGHYFAARGRRNEPDEAPGPPPLYLPRGAVRLALIGGFAAVAVLLYRRGRLSAIESNPGVITLVLVSGFLLGVVLQRVATWWSGRGRRLPRAFEDLRATVSLVAAVLLVVLIWDRITPFLPEPARALLGRMQFGLGRYGPEHVLAAVVGFYFGSRS